MPVAAIVCVLFALASAVAFRRWKAPVAALAVCFGGWLVLPLSAQAPPLATGAFPYWIVGAAMPSDTLLSKAWLAPCAALLGVALVDPAPLRRLRPVPLDLPVLAWCAWPLVQAAWLALAAAPPPSPDAGRASLYLAATWGACWLLGRVCAADAAHRRLLLQAMAWSAVACLPFSLVEGLGGPTLYGTVFGTPHPFAHDGDVRYLGFRPIGFFEHGTQFGLWIAMGALAACGWAATAPAHARRLPRALAALLTAMALAAQSVGAIVLLGLGTAVLAAPRAWPLRRIGLGAALLLALAGAAYLSGAVPVRHWATDTAWGRGLVTAIKQTGRGSLTWRIARDQEVLGPALAHPVVGSGRWDWWAPVGTRPWGWPLLAIGQYGLVGATVSLAVLLAPAVRASAVRLPPGATRWQSPSLVLAAIAMLAAADALFNTFLHLPALVAAAALATGPEGPRC